MTDQPTPAETIKAAATRLREAAKKATPGPWDVSRIYDGDDGWARVYVEADDGTEVSQTLIAADVAYSAMTPDENAALRADPAYIALVNPVVGLAVADWLDAEVALAADPKNHAEVSPTALVVARSLLGGDRD